MKPGPNQTLGPTKELDPETYWGAFQWTCSLESAFRFAESSEERFTKWLKDASTKRIWNFFPNPDCSDHFKEQWGEEPFNDPDVYAKEVFGVDTWKKILERYLERRESKLAEAKALGDLPKKGELGNGRRCDNSTPTQRGSTSATYLLRPLARDFPDILKAYEDGKFRSVRAAAIAAGIIKVPTPLDKARKAVAKLSGDEWRQLSAEKDGSDSLDLGSVTMPTSAAPMKNCTNETQFSVRLGDCFALISRCAYPKPEGINGERMELPEHCFFSEAVFDRVAECVADDPSEALMHLSLFIAPYIDTLMLTDRVEHNEVDAESFNVGLPVCGEVIDFTITVQRAEAGQEGTTVAHVDLN